MSKKLIVVKSDTLEVVVRVVDSDGAKANLTDAVATWKIAESPTAALPLITKTGGEIGISVANGTLSMTLSDSETESLTPREYYHTIRINLPDGRIKTVFRGYLSVVDVP